MEEFTLRPVTGSKFIGRKKLIKELLEELSSSKSMMGYCIYGRRRVGKTSLLQEIRRRLAPKERIVVAYLSFYDMVNLTERTLIEEMSASVVDAYTEKRILPLEFKLKELAKAPLSMASKLLERIKLGADLGDEIKIFLTLGSERVEDYTPYLRSLFNLGEKLAQKTDTKCIIMLDEFPEILRIKNGIQMVKMLRTAHESHEKTVLVISGSIRKTLEAVALSETAPFYKQLIPRRIEPLTSDEVEEFLSRYLDVDDKALAKHLRETTGGIPFYLQYLGRVAKTIKEVDAAVDIFVKEEGGVLFQEEFDALSGKEKIITIALSKGKNTPSQIAKEVGEPVNFVSRYLITLSDKEVAERIGKGKYKLTDRMFLQWLKWKYV